MLRDSISDVSTQLQRRGCGIVVADSYTFTCMFESTGSTGGHGGRCGQWDFAGYFERRVWQYAAPHRCIRFREQLVRQNIKQQFEHTEANFLLCINTAENSAQIVLLHQHTCKHICTFWLTKEQKALKFHVMCWGLFPRHKNAFLCVWLTNRLALD